MDNRGSKSSRKLLNAIETEQSIDRLSGLPDAMLCHILSFLAIKESVATSILARRWRYLWTNFSTLEFDTGMCKRLLDEDTDDILLGHSIRHGHGNSHGRDVIERTSCSDIVNRLLLMQNGQVLNTFILCYKRFGFTDYQIDSWMTVAMSRGVKKIGIHCVSVDELPRASPWRNKLPSSLFRFKTLVDLSLTRCSVYIPTNGIVSLSSLKKLCLVYIKYGDDETLPRLLSGCPDLEKFRMDQENFKWVTVKYLPKLIEADIILYKPLHLGRPWPVGILNGFSNAKSMKLSYRCGEFNGSKFEALTSKFTNLIELQWLSSDSRLLVKFLEKADNLKHLTALLEPPHMFNCLLSHLETVMVGLMYVDDGCIPLVRYLLKNAKMLKVMTVGIRDDLSTIDKEILQDKIFSLERGSPQCMIVFRGLQDCVYSVC